MAFIYAENFQRQSPEEIVSKRQIPFVVITLVLCDP